MPSSPTRLVRLVALMGLAGMAALVASGCQVTDPRRPTLLLPPPMVYATAPGS